MTQTIPAQTLVPFVYVAFDATNAEPGLSIQPYQGLVVGQRLSTGTVDALEPTLVRSEAEAQTFFGEGSQLQTMARAWFASNRNTRTYFVALDDPSGAAATLEITATGTATATGVAYLYVGGRRIAVAVTSGMTATAFATAIAAAVNAESGLEVTAASAVAVATLTYRHVGVIGNGLDVRWNMGEGEGFAAGLDASAGKLGDTVAGAGEPDIDTVWSPAGDVHYNVLASGLNFADARTKLDIELDRRFGPTIALDMVAVIALDDTHANLVSAAAGMNSEHLVAVGTENSPTPTHALAAAVAANVAFEGQADPGRPFKTLELVGALGGAVGDVFSLAEKEILLEDGISVLRRSSTGGVSIERLVSTNKTNALGVPVTAFRPINVALLLSFFRWSMRNRVLQRFPRHKVADDGAAFGSQQYLVTPRIMHAELVALAGSWAERGLIENVDDFKSGLSVVRDGSDPNRMNILMTPDLVNQFLVAAITVEFKL
jgi:phage tail sheath gpL-like